MIDLHTHSTASDGLDSPQKLVQLASQQGLTALALTDHDTLGGLDEAASEAQRLGVFFIRGLEIEIAWPTGEFHLLGLNVSSFDDAGTQALEKLLNIQREQRIARNEEMITLLNVAGFTCQLADVAKLATGDVVGRVHFAHYLVQIKAVKGYQEAFDRYLAYGRPCYVRKEALPLESAVAAIHGAGGKAVIAHPLSLYMSWSKLPEVFAQLKEAGVDGVEVYHSYCKRRQSERLLELALRYDFIITGGSDYHGYKRIDRRLGHSTAGMVLPESLLERLLDGEQWSSYQQGKKIGEQE
jgi:predicted metal-dependent phosphoesterase TrpH